MAGSPDHTDCPAACGSGDVRVRHGQRTVLEPPRGTPASVTGGGCDHHLTGNGDSTETTTSPARDGAGGCLLSRWPPVDGPSRRPGESV